jgi:hypothetical protein
MQTTSRLVAIQKVRGAALERRRLELLKAAYLSALADGSDIAAAMLVKVVAQ